MMEQDGNRQFDPDTPCRVWQVMPPGGLFLKRADTPAA